MKTEKILQQKVHVSLWEAVMCCTLTIALKNNLIIVYRRVRHVLSNFFAFLIFIPAENEENLNLTAANLFQKLENFSCEKYQSCNDLLFETEKE